MTIIVAIAKEYKVRGLNVNAGTLFQNVPTVLAWFANGL